MKQAKDTRKLSIRVVEFHNNYGGVVQAVIGISAQRSPISSFDDFLVFI